MTTTKRRVELWVHTTSGVEFEIRDADTGKVVASRWSVADGDSEDADDLESEERTRVEKRCAELNYDLVGEVWS